MDKKVIKIKKKKEDIKRIKLMSFKNFYNEYMKDIDKEPKEYINDMTLKILECYYYYTSIFEGDKEKCKRIMNVLDTFDYNAYLGIYISHGYGKLKYLGILDTMTNGVIKLFYILLRLVSKYGIDIELKYDFETISESISLNTLFKHKEEKIKQKKMIAIRDNIVIETSRYIEPIQTLEKSNIMISYGLNKFICVPYNYYKKLYNIEAITFEYDIEYRELDTFIDEPLILSGSKTYCDKTGIYSFLKTIMYFRSIDRGITKITNGLNGYIINIINDKILLQTHDNMKEEYNYLEFKNKYLPFI